MWYIIHYEFVITKEKEARSHELERSIYYYMRGLGMRKIRSVVIIFYFKKLVTFFYDTNEPFYFIENKEMYMCENLEVYL